MDNSPTFCISFSFDEEGDSAQSEGGAWPWGDDNEKIPLEEGGIDCLATIKPVGDRNYIDTLDSAKRFYQPQSPSQCDQSLVDTVPLDKQQPQELIDLKLEIAMQKENLDTLSNQLSRYQIENEALKTEKRALEERPTPSSTTRRFSLRRLVNRDVVRSMQVSACSVRESFQSHIKSSVKISDTDKTIEALQQEIDYLRKQQDLSARKPQKTSLDTVMTYLGSNDLIDENQDGMQQDNSTRATSGHDNFYKLEILGKSCWTIEGIDIEDGDTVTKEKEVKNISVEKEASRRNSERSGLLVDFGETRRPARKTIA